MDKDLREYAAEVLDKSNLKLFEFDGLVGVEFFTISDTFYCLHSVLSIVVEASRSRFNGRVYFAVYIKPYTHTREGEKLFTTTDTVEEAFAIVDLLEEKVSMFKKINNIGEA